MDGFRNSLTFIQPYQSRLIRDNESALFTLARTVHLVGSCPCCLGFLRSRSTGDGTLESRLPAVNGRRISLHVPLLYGAATSHPCDSSSSWSRGFGGARRIRACAWFRLDAPNCTCQGRSYNDPHTSRHLGSTDARRPWRFQAVRSRRPCSYAPSNACPACDGNPCRPPVDCGG